MTKDKERWLGIINNQLDAAFDLLSKAVPGQEAFAALCNSLDRLLFFRSAVVWDAHGGPPAEDETAPMEEPTPISSAPAAPAHTEDVPLPTKAQVLAELLVLANEHDVDVESIIIGMGFKKLSGVPQERYPELLETARGMV